MSTTASVTDIDNELAGPPGFWKWIVGYGAVLSAIGIFSCALPAATALAVETLLG